jgi:hypothetical protein
MEGNKNPFLGNRSLAGVILLTADLQMTVICTPIGNRIFDSVLMPESDLVITAVAPLLVLLSIEICKLLLRRRRKVPPVENQARQWASGIATPTERKIMVPDSNREYGVGES